MSIQNRDAATCRERGDQFQKTGLGAPERRAQVAPNEALRHPPQPHCAGAAQQEHVPVEAASAGSVRSTTSPYATHTGNVTIASSSFTCTSNTAIWGGAIGLEDGAVATITESTFTSSSATQSGGAIRASECASFTILDSTFSSNSARCDGGAMSLRGEHGVVISKTDFSVNTDTYDGPAVMRDNNGNRGWSNEAASTQSRTD